jgi:hypothetical protein
MDEESFRDRVVFRYAGRPQPGDKPARREAHQLRRRPAHACRSTPATSCGPPRHRLLLLPGIVDLDGLPLETRPGKNAGAATDICASRSPGAAS